MRMLRTEYGGMNEVLVNLYGLTGKQQYLDTAHLFEQPASSIRWLGTATSCRACTPIRTCPRSSARRGCMSLPASALSRQIAQYFLDEVLTERSYVIGNTSVDESWRSDAGAT